MLVFPGRLGTMNDLLQCALRISLLTGPWKLLRFLHSLVPLAFILQLQSFEVPASLVTDVLFKGLGTKVKRKSILGQRCAVG